MIDLHTHSHYSDGTHSPETLVAMAEKAGLKAIALCDHNTVGGLETFMAAGSKSSVETIPGAELTTGYKGKELHILALFLSPDCYDAVTEKMAPFRKAKEANNQQLFHSLLAAGFQLDRQRIFQGSLDYVNRLAFAKELFRCGYAASTDEAFDKFLLPGLGFYEPAPRADVFDIIRFVRQLGALPVLAHPLYSVSEETLRELLPQAKEAGLAAMETHYSKYTPEETACARQLATEFGLAESGGSDYHGNKDSVIQMGVGKGSLHIPYTILENLKNLL
ncbi:MAG: PHP domain-containing protein [Oscillospiraceae bacterium]|nr:PHP domain-containing protein [Oscillospiraceae bacterium]